MTLNIVNTVLCTAIFILGYWGYIKNRNLTALLVGIAFGIFGVSHILTMLGFSDVLSNFLITIRAIAYLAVVFALSRILAKG